MIVGKVLTLFVFFLEEEKKRSLPESPYKFEFEKP